MSMGFVSTRPHLDPVQERLLIWAVAKYNGRPFSVVRDARLDGSSLLVGVTPSLLVDASACIDFL